MDLFIFILSVLVILGAFVGGLLFLIEDCRKTGHNPVVWVFLYFISGFLALGAYLILCKKYSWGMFALIGAPILLSLFGVIAFTGIMSLISRMF